jgi:hypothetical protein
MALIKLTQGKYAIIDDEDFERVSKLKWNYSKKIGYAESRLENGHLRMHRFIMNAKPGEETDHINFDGLDNRKSNLRLCTHTENMYHRRKHIDNTSGYKGVSWDKVNKKWHASIQKDGKKMHLGRFLDIQDAIKIYNKKASEAFGQFAQLN